MKRTFALSLSYLLFHLISTITLWARQITYKWRNWVPGRKMGEGSHFWGSEQHRHNDHTAATIIIELKTSQPWMTFQIWFDVSKERQKLAVTLHYAILKIRDIKRLLLLCSLTSKLESATYFYLTSLITIQTLKLHIL